MKSLLLLQARRIDALSLRERAIMFVSLAAALVAVADAWVLTPRLAEQKTYAERMRAQSGELDTLRTQAAGGGAADTPAARLQSQLQEVRSQQQALDAQIRHRLSDGSAHAQLPDLLRRVLRRHDRLLLLRLETATDTKVTTGSSLAQQGVDIGVRGDYADLTRYVADAELAMPGLRWGELSITRDGAATELRARVYLAGELP